MAKKVACPYGTHRVISPVGALPQSADVVDNKLPIYDNELLVEVDTLNIDAASFLQMKNACDGDPVRVGQMIMGIVATRGKQQNPVTGSGGMLLGTVKEIGTNFPNPSELAVGDKVASLVSLSLTPLHLDAIIEVYPERDQVKVKGHAIFFATGVVAKIPADIPENLALAVLDVAGAPAQMERLVKPNMNVVMIGAGGKSGTLCCAIIRDIMGTRGQLIAIEPSEKGRARLKELGFCDHILNVSATDPVACLNAVSKVTQGKMAHLVVNCAPVPSTEMASILSCRNDHEGIVYFFSMATSFTKAALGAEGVGSDAKLIIGNGYAPKNDDIALNIIRRHPKVRDLFEKVYCS